MVKELSELSHIDRRYIQVDGVLSNYKLKLSEKEELKSEFSKLSEFKEKLEFNITKNFENIAKMVQNLLKDKIEYRYELVPVGLRYLLNLFHGQNINQTVYQVEETKQEDVWVSPYSEISKALQISLVIEYKTNNTREQYKTYFDVPFVFSLDSKAVKFKNFTTFFKEQINKMALKHLEELLRNEDEVDEFSLEIVNQPEILIASISGNIDKDTFYQ